MCLVYFQSVLYQLATMMPADILKEASHTSQYWCQTSQTTGQILLHTGYMRNTQHGPDDGLDSPCSEEKQDVASHGFHHIWLKLWNYKQFTQKLSATINFFLLYTTIKDGHLCYPINTFLQLVFTWNFHHVCFTYWCSSWNILYSNMLATFC